MRSGFSRVGWLSISAFLIPVLLIGCGNPETDQEEAGPEIVDITEEAGRYLEKILVPYRPLAHAFEAKTYWPDQMMGSSDHQTWMEGLAEMQAALPELQKMTAEAGREISSMPDFRGDSTLKEAVLSYLEYLHRYAKFDAPQAYLLLQQYARDDVPISEAEEAHLDASLERLDAEWDEQGERFEKAQDTFAARYGFDLIPDTTSLTDQQYKAERRFIKP